MTRRCKSYGSKQSGWRQGAAARLLGALALLAGATWGMPARAQSCPGGYSSCDNGGCCLTSDQCCPMLAEGCCAPATPFCCGDGSCAASPPECANAGRNTCTGYEIPCGRGCAPAGSQCCDLSGHYCPPQGMCTSETTCRSGNDESAARLVVSTSAAPPLSAPELEASPLLDPADGTERSCALAATPSAANTAFGGLPLALIVAVAWARRRRHE
jgi:MYXO-CTERM domain-containing protein